MNDKYQLHSKDMVFCLSLSRFFVPLLLTTAWELRRSHPHEPVSTFLFRCSIFQNID